MITLNGSAVVEGKLVLPESGCWRAWLTYDQAAEAEGQVELSDGETDYIGQSLKTGVIGTRGTVRVVGGSGGLRNEQAAEHFQATTVGAVLDAILSAAGESADPFIFPTSRTRSLPYWSTLTASGGANLETLADKNDMFWRVRPSGNVWLGPKTEGLSAPADVEVIHARPHNGIYMTAPDGLWLQPGMEQSFGRVTRVEYLFSEKLRAKVWVSED